MSKQPWQWTEDDILAIVRENQPENLTLEYKAAGSLAKTDGKKAEISKDVSAMANSAGGTLVYGIDEQRAQGGPLKLNPIDPKAISSEWLEQIIDANIQRRIPGLRVTPVQIAGADQVVYVVSVPQSNLAPHMAADKRYHKRLGTTTAQMEEYEVRDVGRRLESPDLHITFRAIPDPDPPPAILLLPYIENYSAEPAFYAGCKLFVQRGHSAEVVRTSMTFDWSNNGAVSLVWNEVGERNFFVYRLFWGGSDCRPLIEGERYQVGRIRLPLTGALQTVLPVGYEIRSPKMTTRMIGCRLTHDQSTDHLQQDLVPLRAADQK